jgi:hypothetical protein
MKTFSLIIPADLSRHMAFGLSLVLLAGCANHQPIRQKPDGTYELSTKLTILSHTESVREQDLEEAEAFAQHKGLQIRILNDDVVERPVEGSVHLLTFQLFDQQQERIKHKACINSLLKNAELNVLEGKLALGGAREQTFSMLANQDHPTAHEKIAIAFYGDLRKICYEEGEKHARKAGVPEAILQLDYGVASSGDVILVALHKGELTYGDYARLRKTLDDYRVQKLRDIERELQHNDPGSRQRAVEMAREAVTEIEKMVEKRPHLTHSEKVFREVDPDDESSLDP